MELNTLILLMIVVFAVGFMFGRGTKESWYRTQNTVNDMGDFKFKKCLCNQQGSALYPAYDGLGHKVQREVTQWGPKFDQDYDQKYFAAVV